jgi:hypothetical protein
MVIEVPAKDFKNCSAHVANALSRDKSRKKMLRVFSAEVQKDVALLGKLTCSTGPRTLTLSPT